MKNLKKIASLLLALVMALALTTTAFAQEVRATPADADNATITINNAAKGETYSVYKLFDATVTGTDGGSIAYQGDIPNSLNVYFTKDGSGNISVVENVNEESLIEALKTWAATATATVGPVESDGSVLKFTDLPYGYYVVTSSQGNGAKITVTSTNPNATIYDKNSTTPGPDGETPVKDSDAANGDVYIGDTVTYTVTFKTTNYDGAGTEAKQIVSYTITDTLPAFLKNVTVTRITIDNTEYKVDNATPQFVNKAITIPWVSGDGTDANPYISLYDNGAVVQITYTATVDDTAQIDGDGNKNAVTISWTDKDGNGPEEDDKITGEETIYTYAIAIKKVSDTGDNLAGATFELPFYVKSNPDAADGAYIYAGTAPAEDDTTITNTVTTPDTGLIIVKGVKAGTYSIKEIAAPNGYNLLTAPVSVTAVKTASTTTTTTIYLDKDGKVVDESSAEITVNVNIDNIAATAVAVLNKTGSTLPTTGGTGTTLFYIIGGILVAGAVILLVTRRRMNSEK